MYTHTHTHTHARMHAHTNTHLYRLDGFNEFLALKSLQYLIDLRLHQIGLEPNISHPNAYTTNIHNLMKE